MVVKMSVYGSEYGLERAHPLVKLNFDLTKNQQQMQIADARAHKSCVNLIKLIERACDLITFARQVA